MPEQETSEKAVAKVKIDLKATKAKAPDHKKSVEFARGAFSWYTSYDSNIFLQVSLCSYLSYLAPKTSE